MDYANLMKYAFMGIGVYLFYIIVFGILHGISGIVIWTFIAIMLFFAAKSILA